MANGAGGFSDREMGSVVVTCSTTLVFKLLLYRGKDERGVSHRIELFSSEENLRGKSPFFVVEKPKSGSGVLEVKTLTTINPEPKWAKITFLDNPDEGLILKLETDNDINSRDTAAERLRMLGFYKEPGLSDSAEESRYLDFFMALTHCLRSVKEAEKIEEISPGSWSLLDGDDYWAYDYNEYILPEPKDKGDQSTPLNIFRLKLLRGVEKLDGKIYVRVGSHIIPDAEIQNGILEIQIPGRAAAKMDKARLYYLDETGEFNGQGLSLKLEKADVNEAPDAAQRLQAMGLYKAPLPPQGLTSALKGQNFLNFFLAWAAWIRARSGGRDKVEYDPAALGKLNRDEYWRYQPSRHTLPDRDFKGKTENEDVFRLKLLRGNEKRSGEVCARVGSYIVPEAKIKYGVVEIQVPRYLAPKINKAQLFFLDGAGDFTGKGLSLRLVAADTSQTLDAAQRLQAMGLYKAPLPPRVPVSALKGQSFLNFFVAWAAWIRAKSGGKEEIEYDPIALTKLNEEDYWEYRPNKHTLPDRDFKGKTENEDVFRLKLLRGNEKRSGEVCARVGSYIVPETKIKRGVLEIQVPRYLAPKINKAHLFFLDGAGDFTGKGLSLRLETADAEKAVDAAQRLQAMGLYKAPLPPQGPVSALKGQSYLNFFLAWVAWIRARSEGRDKVEYNPAALAKIDRDDYLEYQPGKHTLPDRYFKGQTKTEDVFRLKLLRGNEERSGEVCARVGSYIVPETKIKSGVLEIQVPRYLAPKINKAHLFFLDGAGDFTGKGLSLRLETADAKKAVDAAQRLQAMGHYKAPLPPQGPVAALKRQSYLNFFLAWAAWIRAGSGGRDKVEYNPAALGKLDQDDYLEYQPRKHTLPDRYFRDKTKTEDVFRLKLLRGNEKREGKVCAKVGSYIVPETQIKNGVVEIQVPKDLAPKINKAHLFFLGNSGEFTGKGLSLRLETADAEKAVDAAQRLQAMGHYKAPLPPQGPVAALKGQSYLSFFLAWAAWIRAKSGGREEVEYDPAAPGKLDQDDYLEYQPRKHTLPDRDFKGKTKAEDVFRLKLLRGNEKREGKVCARVGSYIIPEAKIKGGIVKIEVPKDLAPKINKAHLFFLGNSGEFTGKGLSLRLETADAEKAVDAAQRLQAMGLYKAPLPPQGPVAALKGQSYLNFFVAWAAWIRAGSGGRDKVEYNPAALGKLDKDDYLEYQPRKHELPDKNFAGRPARYTSIDFRLKQTIEEGMCRVVTDYNLMSEVNLKSPSDTISVRVPTCLADKIERARIYDAEQGEKNYEYIEADKI